MIDKNEILAQINGTSIQERVDNILVKTEGFLQTNPSLALSLAQEANVLSRNEVYTEGIANSLKLVALSFQYLTNYAEAMKYALEAKEIFQAINNKRGEAACLNILGAVYNFLGELNKRLACNIECLALRVEIKDEKAQLGSLNNIGDTYLSLKDYDNALTYFNQCLTFSNIPDNILAIVNSNIAEVYYYKNNFELAKQYNQLGLEYALKSNYLQIIIANHTLLAEIYLHQKQAEIAILELEKALKLLSVSESKEQEFQIYELLSQAYSQKKDWENAYLFLNKHNKLKSKVMQDNNAQKMNKIEFDYQYQSITTEAKEIKEKNELLTKAFTQIEKQSQEIQEQNKAITDSIHYAKRIQFAILPENEKVKKCLDHYFIFYQPKDIVSGDFYWVEQIGDHIVFSVVDCTGHGVPGAFVSLIGYNALNKVVLEKQITQPSLIINEMNTIVTDLFKSSEENIRDGMDMGVCTWNKKRGTLQFAGAFNSLFLFSDNELTEIKGNRESVGASIYKREKKFVNHEVSIKQGDVLYLSSDGFPDQFGGKKGRKLKWKGFRELLSNIAKEPIQSQQKELATFFNSWKDKQEQLDDVCIIGVKI